MDSWTVNRTNRKHATYRAKIGLFAHMVAGEQLVQSQTLIGLDWDNRQRRKLAEYFCMEACGRFPVRDDCQEPQS